MKIQGFLEQLLQSAQGGSASDPAQGTGLQAKRGQSGNSGIGGLG